MLYYPSYIASNGTLYVSDTGHHRIYRFPGGPFGEEGGGEGEFIDPRGVALDGAGNIYVVDAGNNRVQKFDDEGAFALEIVESQAADGDFGSLAGVAVDSEGNVFVVDEGRDCIHKFRPAGAMRQRRKSAAIGRREGGGRHRTHADEGAHRR
jgi:sugar lactone lactonase YvrE